MRFSERNGIYLLEIPHSDLGPFYVYCMADPQRNGSAWTVFMNRYDGSVDFSRDWHGYKEGFGNLEGEFWLGLKYINALTTVTRHPQELWIEMEDWECEMGYAKYSSFALSDESNGFTINLLGGYRGNVGDSLSFHQGLKFATKDNDVKSSEVSCAATYKGGWWYNPESCHKR